MKNTELINARFTYINNINDYKLLLSFRTKMDKGGYDYTKINIDVYTSSIDILDNSIIILSKLREYFLDKEEEINTLGKDINQLNRHISEIVGANIDLSGR